MRYERTPIVTALPVASANLAEYARVTDADGMAELERLARAAAAEIEHYADLALLSQTITATTDLWPGQIIALPIGPVLPDASLTVAVVEQDGTETNIADGWWVEAGRYPRLHFTGGIPGAPLRITYCAGYGSTADVVPHDLRIAIIDEATRTFDMRADDKQARGLSPAASRILARHRRVRA